MITAMLIQDKTPETLPDSPCCLSYGLGTADPQWQGINIELYPPMILITLFQDFGDDEIKELVHSILERYPDSPLLVQDRSRRPAFIRLKIGNIPGEMEVKEQGLSFLIHPERGQNMGFFPDMRIGRRKIAELTDAYKKKTPQDEIRILNLFSYTCSLSVVALAAGADKVVNIDKNARSLDIGKKNHRLNHGNIPGGFHNQARFLPHDIFKSLGKLRREGPYQLIIADPPPSQKGSFNLRKDYPRLIKRLPEMLTPLGALILTLNHPGYNWKEFESMIVEALPGNWDWQPIDPPKDYRPLAEGTGLKMICLSRKD